jgi:hypothetical protein
MKGLTTRLALLFFLFFSQNAWAQSPCAADHLHEQLKEIDPAYQARRDALEQQVQQYLAQQKNKKKGQAESQAKGGALYTIPVVVHVIYTAPNAINNISDAQVESAIQRLNDVYSNATGLSVNTGIEFCLASRDPNCQPTNGILHVNGSSVTDYAAEGIDSQVNDTDGKGAKMSSIFKLSRWNPAEYLNIYIVSEISDNNGGSGVQGYAFYPGAGYAFDGVVILYNAFGYDYNNCGCFQLKSYTNTNATAIHEVGHYFNLRHTFDGDGNGSTCPDTTSTAGDGVADTPAHIFTYSCATGSNNCYPAGHPFNDWGKIIHNYMGYAVETCKHEFTQGQVDRMVAALETHRYALTHAQSCQDVASPQPPPAACSPQTTTGILGNYGMGPIRVTIGDLVAGSGSAFEDGGYLNKWCNSGTFAYNTTYPIAINTFGLYDEDVRVYIDYNNDGDMPEDELVFDSQDKKAHAGSFTIPNSATPNTPLRLRIISDYFSFSIASSCHAPTYGQVEDYAIYIDGLNPVLNASANDLQGFFALTNKASAAKSFTLFGSDLGANVTVSTASNEFELSDNGVNFTGSLLFNPVNHVLNNKSVYVRLKAGLPVGSYTGSLEISTPGVALILVGLQGEVGKLDTLRGQALLLGEGGGYVETALPLPASYTQEAWVNYASGTALLASSTANGHALSVQSGRLSGGHGGNWATVQDAADMPVGEWLHVALSYDAVSKEMKLYKNGLLAGQASNVAAHGGGQVLIGALAQGSFFYGKMDEVRIWGKVRSAQEIRENMHLTLTGQEAGLLAYYQFNENDSTGLAQERVGGYDGSLSGDAALVPSGINCGRGGSSQTITGIGSVGVKNFNSANCSLVFTAKNGTEDFTATYQAFEPNTTNGAQGVGFLQNPVWTINRSTATGSFTAHIAFTFPPNTLVESSPGSYALYHRSAHSSGDWALLSDTASALAGNTVTFENIGVTGQFMLVQTKETSERGHALSLGGNGAYMATPLQFDPVQGPFTIEFWAKAEGNEKEFQVMFDKTGSQISHLFLMAVWRNKLFVRFGGVWLDGAQGKPFSYHKWHHIAFVWDGEKCSLYVDGKLEDCKPINGLASSTEQVFFGAYRENSLYFEGKLEEIRIWQAARSQQDIAENMHLTAGPKMANPLAYYQFNQSGGNAVSDYAQANVATVFGNAAFVPSGANVGSTGFVQTRKCLAGPGVRDFAAGRLKIEFASLADSSSFTVVYQPFKPNSTNGPAAPAAFVYNKPTWTILQHNDAEFLADFTFTFPNATFSQASPDAYKLYHRPMGSDGDWELLVPAAASVTANKVTFQGVERAGQFMVVRE